MGAWRRALGRDVTVLCGQHDREWLRVAGTAAAALALLLGACRGSGGSAAPAMQEPAPTAAATSAARQATPGAGFKPIPASAELLVGRNRFALGVLDDRTGAPLPDAQVHFRFFELQGNQGTLRFEAAAAFRAPAR